jgi:LemA protein
MMSLFLVVGLIAIVASLGLVAIYNGLVKSKVRVDEAWSDITVQLKRRYDLIPNLINTVKGYAKHEADVLQNVTSERANALQGQGDVKDVASAENAFSGALKSIFAVAESYPDLKANQNFLDLQAQLTDTEDKIQAARRFYNASVRDLNIKIKTFPTLLFAKMLGFSEREFFEVDESENASIQKPVDVKF